MKQCRVSLFLLWLFVTVGYTLYRSISPYLVWDDTNWIHAYSFPTGFPHPVSLSSFFQKYIIDSFSHVNTAGYRPLNATISSFGRDFFISQPCLPVVWFFIVGMIVGYAAVVFFILARKFVKTDIAALAIVFLYMTSSPIVSSYWIVVMAIHTLVPLFISLGLIIYWKIREQGKARSRDFVFLGILMFFGAWYREFVGVLPLLIIILELLRQRKITWLICFAVAALLHSLSPMILMKTFLFHDLPGTSIFKVGSLGQKLGQLGAKADLFWDPVILFYYFRNLLWHLYSLIPSILWGLAALSLIVQFARRQTGVPIINKDVVFLFLWFLLTFLPFIVVFTEQVHLGYCLLPAIILIAIGIEKAFLDLKARPNLAKRWGPVFIFLAGIIVVDQLGTLAGSARVVYAMNNGMRAVAQELKNRIPKDSIVISNALHGGDIQTYSQNYFMNYWSVKAGVPWPQYAIEDKNALEKLVEEKGAVHGIYFLSMDFDYTPDKVRYHSHQFVRDPSIPKQYIGKVYETRAQYFFADPLKNLTPRPFISFLGAPDLENDFYRGPCRDGKSFCREVYAEYNLYKLLTPKLDASL